MNIFSFLFIRNVNNNSNGIWLIFLMWQKSTEIAQHLYRLQLKFLFRFISVYPSYACVVMPISNELDTVSQSNGDRFHLRLHHLVLMRLNYFHELRCKKVCVCVCVQFPRRSDPIKMFECMRTRLKID